jgi:hypothetical protein
MVIVVRVHLEKQVSLIQEALGLAMSVLNVFSPIVFLFK